MSLNRLVLCLNSAYEACNIVPAKRALTLVCGGKAVVEVPSPYYVRTAKISIQIPSVIRFLHYRRVPRHNRAVSRKSIMLRDRLTCQYCLKPFAANCLTLDHVLPRSKGGLSTWQNLVASCKPCNHLKGDRTPEQAGMPLAHKPAAIGVHAKHRLMAGTACVPEWDQFLFC